MRRNLLNLLRQNKGRGFFNADAATNTIFIYDIIVPSDADAEWFGGVSAESFAKTLATMNGPISLRINSPGGDVFAGQAFYNAIRAYPDPVTAYVDGWAASAASTIAIAADSVVMSGDGAMFMIHKAWTLGWGNADDFRGVIDLLDKIDANLARQYAAKAGKTAEDVMALLNAGDTYFTAQEAIDFGLADSMANSKDKGAQNSIKWDLSAYEPHSATNDVKPQAAPNDAVPADRDGETEAQRAARLRQHAVRVKAA